MLDDQAFRPEICCLDETRKGAGLALACRPAGNIAHRSTAGSDQSPARISRAISRGTESSNPSPSSGRVRELSVPEEGYRSAACPPLSVFGEMSSRGGGAARTNQLGCLYPGASQSAIEELMQDLPRPEDLSPGIDPPRPISVTFIPARVFDNPILLQVNPEYFTWLLALPLRERERLLGGNWKIRPAAGLYFKREWCAVVDEAPADLDVVPLLGSRRHRKDRVQRPRLDGRHQARPRQGRRLLINGAAQLAVAVLHQRGGSGQCPSLTELQISTSCIGVFTGPQDVVFGAIFFRIGGPGWTAARMRGVKRDLRPMSRRWARC